MAQHTVLVDIVLLGKMAGYIEMLVKDPYSTVFAALSDIYRTFGLHEEAVAVAQKGSEMVPTYAPGFIALGRALAEKGDPAGASNAYRQALSLDPVNLAALTGLVSSCLGCGLTEEALVLLTRAQSIDPDDEVVKQLFPIVKKLAVIPATAPALGQNSFTPPIEVTEVVVEEQSDHVLSAVPLPPIATATLADIYIQQGFFERALKVFSDLLEEDPGNTEIRRRYDDLKQQINGSVMIESPAVATAAPINAKPAAGRTAIFPEGTGKDALIALYSRWLDAINRRRADVH